MEKEETNVIEDLYTLRAGLSIISQQHDEAKQIISNSDEEIKANCQVLINALPKIDEYNCADESLYEQIVLNEILLQYRNANKAAEMKQKDEVYLNKLIKRHKLYIVAILTIIPAAIALLITFCYFGVIYLMQAHPLCYLFAILAGATIVASVISLRNISLSLRFNKRRINDIKSEINKFNNFIQIYPEYWKNINNIRNIRNIKLTSIVKSCNNLFAALQQQYNYMLDMRDWKNLDLVLFALETRRASDIKEALVYVDGEIRTQRIENALSQATEYICMSISKVGQAIVHGISEISAKLDQQNTLLTQINDGIWLNNALRAKANVTSEQLMNDIDDIKRLLK